MLMLKYPESMQKTGKALQKQLKEILLFNKRLKISYNCFLTYPVES